MVISTTPAIEPVAMPAMVPLDCCLAAEMVGSEESAALVRSAVEVGDAVLDGVWDVDEGFVENVVEGDSVGRDVGRVEGDVWFDVGRGGRCVDALEVLFDIGCCVK